METLLAKFAFSLLVISLIILAILQQISFLRIGMIR